MTTALKGSTKTWYENLPWGVEITDVKDSRASLQRFIPAIEVFVNAMRGADATIEVDPGDGYGSVTVNHLPTNERFSINHVNMETFNVTVHVNAVQKVTYWNPLKHPGLIQRQEVSDAITGEVLWSNEQNWSGVGPSDCADEPHDWVTSGESYATAIRKYECFCTKCDAVKEITTQCAEAVGLRFDIGEAATQMERRGGERFKEQAAYLRGLLAGRAARG